MKKKSRLLLILAALLLDIFSLKSQSNDPFITSIKKELSTYCKTVPLEDIFVHSDRETYISGEYLWFSTYLFDRHSSSLSSLSSYAYVELLDQANLPVSQVKVRLENGSGGGEIILPDSLSSGEYTLRAYTNWMKNFLPDGCFTKTITVYNPIKESPIKKKNPGYFPGNSKYNVTLFPEGGSILSGFENRVGVRVYNKEPVEKKYMSYLLDETNDTISTVFIDSTGIGSFEFFVEKGKKYRLVSNNGGDTYPLPLSNKTGISMNVNNLGNDSMRIIVNTDNALVSTGNYFYVVGQSRGNVLFGDRINYSGHSTRFSVSTNKLRSGINQITIFDSQGKPVCDRYVFRPIPVSDNLIIKTADRIGKRKNLDLEIYFDTTLISKNESSNYSLSVSAVSGPGLNPDIADYLITGNEYIALDGSHYGYPGIFNMSLQTIDDYLLSVKSNWINWENIMVNKTAEIKYPFEKGKQYLSGISVSTNSSGSNPDKILFLSIPGKVPVFKYARTDHKNRFIFAIRDNESSDEYIIQPSDTNDRYIIQIESLFSENYPESEYYIDTTVKVLSDDIVRRSVNYQVGKIYGISSAGDTINKVLSHSRPIRFYGKPDKELILSDYISLPFMEEVFFELLPGVKVKSHKSKREILIQDPVYKNFNDDLPVLLVDGVIIQNPSVILNLDPDLVEKIDIIKGEYAVGELVFYGIINVITKAGDFSNVSLPSNSIRIRNYGYNLERKFKSPDYSAGSDEDDRFPDFRNTIYWNNMLKPDEKGIIKVNIMTSDFASDYEINFQGVSGGRLFSFRKTITVE